MAESIGSWGSFLRVALSSKIHFLIGPNIRTPTFGQLADQIDIRIFALDIRTNHAVSADALYERALNQMDHFLAMPIEKSVHTPGGAAQH